MLRHIPPPRAARHETATAHQGRSLRLARCFGLGPVAAGCARQRARGSGCAGPPPLPRGCGTLGDCVFAALSLVAAVVQRPRLRGWSARRGGPLGVPAVRRHPGRGGGPATALRVSSVFWSPRPVQDPPCVLISKAPLPCHAPTLPRGRQAAPHQPHGCDRRLTLHGPAPVSQVHSCQSQRSGWRSDGSSEEPEHHMTQGELSCLGTVDSGNDPRPSVQLVLTTNSRVALPAHKHYSPNRRGSHQCGAHRCESRPY